MSRLVVGTRGSALALTQTGMVCAALRRAHPGLEIEVQRITTTGDAKSETPLAQLGRGVFVTEIENALRDGRIDFAVHSAKDMPSVLERDFAIAAFCERADARDVLVSPYGAVRDLPAGARVGTSSPRRACLLRALRSDVVPVEVRGNVDTRLCKLHAGEFDALMLAAAGLLRLGREHEITEWLDVDAMIPAVGQGALALECRAGDAAVATLLGAVDHAPTRFAVTAERAFLAELGAGCRAAAGAHAVTTIDGGVPVLRMTAFIGAPDGTHVRAAARAETAEGGDVGTHVARHLLRQGGAAFLGRRDSALAGMRILITRPRAQALELGALLEANGARVLSCPTIAIRPVNDSSLLDAALRDLAGMHWLIFTSANAVDAVADRMEALGLHVPADVRVAAVGPHTAASAARRIRHPDAIASSPNAVTLAAELPVDAGDRVLYPRSNMARSTVTDALQERGALVRNVIAYRTDAAPEVPAAIDLLRAEQLDAVIFASPSALLAGDIAETIRALGARAPVVTCIGGVTADAARRAGLGNIVQAATPAVGAIVDVLERAMRARRGALVTS